MHLDEVVGCAIIDMYLKCGSLLDADTVFEDLAIKDVVSWSAMILGYADQGHGQKALNLYSDMLSKDICPNKLTFLGVLKACWLVGNLRQGLYMHSEVVSQSLDSDLVVANTLIGMYAKCGALNEARHVFDLLSSKDGVSYNSMIQGYMQNEHSLPALDIYSSMRCRGIRPNKVTFPTILKACSNIRALEQGRLLHMEIIRDGMHLDEVVGSAIIDMYLKCGSLLDADTVFEDLAIKDVISWSAMILGYADQGHGQKALNLYSDMLSEDICPNKLTFLGVLKACWLVENLRQGLYMHSEVVSQSLDSDLVVANTLIGMYAKCGALNEARHVFDLLSSKDGVSYNSMIQGYVQNEHSLPALDIYSSMRCRGIRPNKVTFPTILKACSNIRALIEARQIHANVITEEFDNDSTIQSAIVDMYAKCGSMVEAINMFERMQIRDIVLWGTIFSGCAQSGDWQLARQYFLKMQGYNLKPDAWVFNSILTACSHAGEVNEGRWYFLSMIHDYRIKPSA
ncbi:hypothetical protein KP509_25G022800 [Ceratopteris richardii]|uniref:Pentatricopeptide repeat-containing protein n=1 Tax=Ceratopteris richardii TaxID=49495 RepID=A0A8T2RNJ0_CERRI|nr:hypothetical protein KP509_25G022800 [Ceratopteris richardii]